MPDLRQTWRTIVELWPIAIALIGIIIGGAKVYFTVEANSKQITAIAGKLETNPSDREQWRQIRNARERLGVLETWREKIDDLTTPDEVQEWGWIKEQVRDTRHRLDAHLREDH